MKGAFRVNKLKKTYINFCCTIFPFLEHCELLELDFCQFVGVAFKVIRKKGRCIMHIFHNITETKTMVKVGH